MATILIDHQNGGPRIAGPDEAPLYEARRKIFPQSVHGTFRTIKWVVLVVTLGIYYLLPFVRWDRGPDAPHQAVLVDFTTRRFYFFFIEIWPQEVYYFTGLLVLAALILFLMNAVAGRLWCGYLCPQTVWTDLFLLIERWTEGDRRARLLAEKAPWTAEKAARKGAKHLLWLIVAWWTGGAWVLYFADAPTLVHDLATFQAPAVTWTAIGILTFTTYALAGTMREQVCVFMCPWPRIQAALTDEYALNVSYRVDRGEPRASLKKAAALRAESKPAGDCIDCDQCVHVCPTGVDIRKGLQLACIQCGLCIDACDAVMTKVGRATGLIAYDSEINLERRLAGQPQIRRIVRPRTILYTALIVLVAALMVAKFATRTDEGLSVIHDRNPMYVRLSDGAIRNAFTMRVLNKQRVTRHFTLAVDGLPGAGLDLVNAQHDGDGTPTIEVAPDTTAEVRVLVGTHETLPPQASVPLTFRLTDPGTGEVTTAQDYFKGP
jgi:cytochrome c oxidase accessory protein FixG